MTRLFTCKHCEKKVVVTGTVDPNFSPIDVTRQIDCPECKKQNFVLWPVTGSKIIKIELASTE